MAHRRGLALALVAMVLVGLVLRSGAAAPPIRGTTISEAVSPTEVANLSAGEPVPGYDALARRLEVAEREIQALRAASTNPDQPEDNRNARPASFADEVAPAQPATDLSTSDLSALQEQVDRLKAQIESKTFPTLEVHGVFQADTGWVGQTENSLRSVGDIPDGSDFRRARLSANGKVVENMAYFLQMDFAFFGRPTFTDVWMELNDVPVLGHVRVGQWKQPFNLEVSSSFRYTMFAERSVLFQSFAPFRHIALGFYDWAENECATWAFSVYRPGQDQYGGSVSDNGNWGLTGRVTWLPYSSDEGDDYLNVGVGYNYVASKDRTVRFRTIPEFFLGESAAQTPIGTSGQAVPGPVNGMPFFVDTGNIAANHYNLLGTELLWVRGPLTVMSEANYNFVAQTNGPALGFPGFFAQIGWFLTGEHRPFNKPLAQIDRIAVHNPLGWNSESGCWGWGGWEFAARYSYLNLNDENIRGGELQDATLGLNWYLNSYAKVQFNYIRAFLDNPTRGSSQTDIYGLRAQVDF